MIHTTGIIINGNIFIHSNHVVKMDKTNVANSDGSCDYMINIYMTNGVTPVSFTFDSEMERDSTFNQIIKMLYGNSNAYLNIKTK